VADREEGRGQRAAVAGRDRRPRGALRDRLRPRGHAARRLRVARVPQRDGAAPPRGRLLGRDHRRHDRVRVRLAAERRASRSRNGEALRYGSASARSTHAS
jgi:hypothetical protein